MMLAMASNDSNMNSPVKPTVLPSSFSIPPPTTSSASTSKQNGVGNSQPGSPLTGAPAVPSQPAALLPNGVQVRQLGGLTPELLKTLFPDSDNPSAEAIKAFNLTTQLTLKYIQQMNLQRNVIRSVSNPRPTQAPPKKPPVTILPKGPLPSVPNILSRQAVPSPLQQPLIAPNAQPLITPNASKNKKPAQISTQTTNKQKATISSAPAVSSWASVLASSEKHSKNGKRILSSRETPWLKPWTKRPRIIPGVTQPQGLPWNRLPQEKRYATTPSGITHEKPSASTPSDITREKLSATTPSGLAREKPSASTPSDITREKLSTTTPSREKLSTTTPSREKLSAATLSGITHHQKTTKPLPLLKRNSPLKSDTVVSPPQASQDTALEPRKRKQKLSCLEDGMLLSCFEDTASQRGTKSKEKRSLVSRKRKRSLLESSKSYLSGLDTHPSLDNAPLKKKKKVLSLKKPRLNPSNVHSLKHSTKKQTLKSKSSKLSSKKLPSQKLTTASSPSSGRNFVKRMASLNASARVSALMELESVISKSVATCKKEKIASTLHKLAKSGKLPAGEYIAVEHPELEYEPEFNTLGLLYNGSTIHPSARKVFYSPVNGDLVLPSLIHPLIFPSKVSTVGKLVKRSLEDAQHFRPKLPKSNNGWTAFGNPIKTIEYVESGVKTKRQYYIGIQRKKKTVFVRDTVVLKAGKNEKPYVGKIVSIWREKGDGLLMSVFWYYRPDEVGLSAGSGLTFAENELLASQHYDVNSVACIEDKCYILGRVQHCRYRAAMAGVEHHSTLRHMHYVPPVPSRDSSSHFVHFPTEKWSEELGHTHTDLGPSMNTLVKTDPSFVYICHRGYNHITGRIYQ